MWLRSLSGHVTKIPFWSCDWDHSLAMWLRSCDWDHSRVMWLRSLSGHVTEITLWTCDWDHSLDMWLRSLSGNVTEVTLWSWDWGHSLVMGLRSLSGHVTEVMWLREAAGSLSYANKLYNNTILKCWFTWTESRKVRQTVRQIVRQIARQIDSMSSTVINVFLHLHLSISTPHLVRVDMVSCCQHYLAVLFLFMCHFFLLLKTANFPV